MINNENGLPREIQKFLDEHLNRPTDGPARNILLDAYAAAVTEQERQAFLDRYLPMIDDEDFDENESPEESHAKMLTAIAEAEKRRQN
jgi:hypothetical protein